MKDEWKSYFYYDENSKSFLKWKVDIFTGKDNNRLLVSKGSDAGCLHKKGDKGYWRVQLNGKNILVHRIVYYIHNDCVDDSMFIDHIDGNGLNNSIENLRLIHPTLNARNVIRLNTNKSGVTGVSLKTCIENNGKPYTYWVAQWRDLNNKVKSKCYSTNKYGYDEAFRLACEYREKMILDLNAQGAGYTERHGTVHDGE